MLTVDTMKNNLIFRCLKQNYRLKSSEYFYKSFGGCRMGSPGCESAEMLADSVLWVLDGCPEVLLNVNSNTSAIKKLDDGRIAFFDSHLNNVLSGIQDIERSINGKAILVTFNTREAFKNYLKNRYAKANFSKDEFGVGVDVDGVEFEKCKFTVGKKLVTFDSNYVDQIKICSPRRSMMKIKLVNPITKSDSSMDWTTSDVVIRDIQSVTTTSEPVVYQGCACPWCGCITGHRNDCSFTVSVLNVFSILSCCKSNKYRCGVLLLRRQREKLILGAASQQRLPPRAGQNSP